MVICAFISKIARSLRRGVCHDRPSVDQPPLAVGVRFPLCPLCDVSGHRGHLSHDIMDECGCPSRDWLQCYYRRFQLKAPCSFRHRLWRRANFSRLDVSRARRRSPSSAPTRASAF